MCSQWYAQCTPGGSPATTTSVPVQTTLQSTSVKTTATPGKPTTLTTIVTATSNPVGGTGPGTPSTLLPNWYWIRAVAEPNYHSYLQARPTGAPAQPGSFAYLGQNTHAAQLNVISGQLVLNRGEGVAPLYMNVENPTDKTQRRLTTWFNATENPYGTFAFQGDTLTWSTPDIKRPNLAAWYVCGDQQLFVNTGAYLYQTPDGCADQTVSNTQATTAG